MSRRIMNAIARALGDNSTTHHHAAPYGHGYVCRDPNCTSPDRHIEI